MGELGPAVPEPVVTRGEKLVEEHGEEPFWKIHKENVEEVYEVEIEL